MKDKKSKKYRPDSDFKLTQQVIHRQNKNISKLAKRLEIVEMQISEVQKAIALYASTHVGINRMILVMNESLYEIKRSVEGIAGLDIGSIDLKVVGNLMEEAKLRENIAKEEAKEAEPSVADWDFSDLDLDVGTINVLKNAGINSAGDLRSLGEGGLMSIKGLGRKRISQIINEFERLELGRG